MKQHILILKGIDCANCAQRIEDALNALPNTKEANIDFSTNMLYIYTDNLTKVIHTITHIETQVSVLETSSSYISPLQEDTNIHTNYSL